ATSKKQVYASTDGGKSWQAVGDHRSQASREDRFESSRPGPAPLPRCNGPVCVVDGVVVSLRPMLEYTVLPRLPQTPEAPPPPPLRCDDEERRPSKQGSNAVIDGVFNLSASGKNRRLEARWTDRASGTPVHG